MFFWKRRPALNAGPALTPAERCRAMGQAVAAAAGRPWAELGPRQQSALATFLVGMVSAVGMKAELPQDETVALAREALREAFGLVPNAANRAVRTAIDATRTGQPPGLRAQIDRGIDAEALHGAGDTAALTRLVVEALQAA